MEKIVYGQIYAIYCKVSGKYYVGKTTDTAENRFREHIHESKKERCRKRPLYAAMNKYGIENFQLMTLESKCPEEKLNEMEMLWISKLNSFHHGYNATKGGDGTICVDRISVIDAYNELGTVKDVRKKLGVDNKTIKKILSNAGIEITPSQDINKQLHGQRVDMIDADGNVLKSFVSLCEAADYLIQERSLNPEHKRGYFQKIKLVCNGVRKIAYGHQWKWGTKD